MVIGDVPAYPLRSAILFAMLDHQNKDTYLCTLACWFQIGSSAHFPCTYNSKRIFSTLPPASVLLGLSGVTLRLWEKFQVRWRISLLSHLHYKWNQLISLPFPSLSVITSVLQLLCVWSAPAWPLGGLSHLFRFRKPFSPWPTWGSVHLPTYRAFLYMVYGWFADTWISASVRLVQEAGMRSFLTELSDMWALRNYGLSLFSLLLIHRITELGNHTCTCK